VDGIAASMDNGVLSLIVPKSERAKRRTIAIASGGEQPTLETTAA
jgi:HSP20 family molecular chaperone IbpA